MTIKGILRNGYYVGKLLLTGLYALLYLKWLMWKAKHTFRKELVRNGMPESTADKLALEYNAQSKSMIRSVIGRGAIGKKP